MRYEEIVGEHSLDVSIIPFRETLTYGRIDSEYYRQDFLILQKRLATKASRPLSEIAAVDGGKRLPAGEQFSEAGIRYVRVVDILNNFIDYSRIRYVSEELHKKLKRYQIKHKDILLTIVGNTVGLTGYNQENYEKCNFTENCARIRAKSISPEFLLVVLTSSVGQKQVQRERVGTAQPKLALERLRNFLIPTPSKQFEEQIVQAIVTAEKVRKEGEKYYDDVQQLLLQELNLIDHKSTGKNISIRSVVEATQANRFDAEYWQPRYDEILRRIKAYKGGYDALPDLAEVSDQLEKIDPEKEYGYVELADVDATTGGVSNVTTIKGSELPSRARMKLKQNDVIVSSVEGSLDKVALISNKVNNLLGSTGFFVFRGQTIKPEVLLVMLKSAPFQTILKREAQGTILSAIPKSSLKRIFLPKLELVAQNIIIESVRRAQELDTEAKALIDLAKRAVEVFIEKDENAALKIIETAL